MSEAGRKPLGLRIEKIVSWRSLSMKAVVRSEVTLKLREAVTSLGDARVIVLDLSDVRAIESGGPGMLLFLQRWACVP
jgi:hypothetical protein